MRVVTAKAYSNRIEMAADTICIRGSRKARKICRIFLMK